MSKKKEENIVVSKSEKLQGHISSFLSDNKKLLIIVCSVIIVAVIVVGIVLFSNSKSLEKRFNEINTLQSTYSALLLEDSASAEYQQKMDELVSQTMALSKAGGKNYPGARAEYLLGEIYWHEENWQQAMDAFLNTYSRMPKTYLGSLSLFNAGAAAENLGDYSKAMEYYQQVWDEYGASAAESPKALFGVGRLYERNGNTQLAQATFQQLADEFPSSEYAKLAQNRLILL